MRVRTREKGEAERPGEWKERKRQEEAAALQLALPRQGIAGNGQDFGRDFDEAHAALVCQPSSTLQ